MFNKKELKNLEIANGRRRERTMTEQEITEEVAFKVEILLENGLLKKNLNKVIISNNMSVSISHRNRAYYTAYSAILTGKGTIKNIKVWESSCGQCAYGDYNIDADIRINTEDYSLEQIELAIKSQLFSGNL